MVATFENMQKLGKEQFEAVTAATAAVTKGWQGIATETTDYSKKSFENSRALAEKIVGVKKIDEAIQLQSDFAKTSYEDFMAQAAKLGEMYASLAKEAFKPMELAAKACTAAAE